MGTKATFGQALQALNLINAKDQTAERLVALYNSGILSDLLEADLSRVNRHEVRAALKLARSSSLVFPLVVNYEESLEEMISSGRYDLRGRDISSHHFPIGAGGVVEFEARYFCADNTRSTPSESALKDIFSSGPVNPWWPARIEHLLSHGKMLPDAQLHFPIVALGGGHPYVSCLDWLGMKRRLRLYSLDFSFLRCTRFLAVRLAEK